MTRSALLLGSAVSMGLLLAAGSARAVTCSTEIMALQQQMDATPTSVSNNIPNPAAGPAPLPGAIAWEPGATLGAPPASDAARLGYQAHATPGGSGEAGTRPGADQLRGTNANGGILVQSNVAKRVGPMNSDITQATRQNTPVGTDAAAQSLMRARALDQAGDEVGCLNAINEAKSQFSRR